MTTATVHHLPGAAKAERTRELDEQAKTLEPGQWVRVTWRDVEGGSAGTVEGILRKPSHLRESLFIGSGSAAFCLTIHGLVNIDVTDIDTEKRPELDLDELSDRTARWCDAQLEFEQKPVGRFGTGDRTREENAMLEAEDYVRTYLKAVRI